jgi:methylmalonyl-CoA/ethylmalonyl-CoA epimerase
MIKGVRRVIVAVQDLEAALTLYRDALGLPVAEELSLPANGLKLVRLDAGGTIIELMQPLDSTGPVADFLRRNGEGLHHIALEVDDIELEMRTLLARGIDLIDHEPRRGPGGQVAFIHPRSAGGVMIELNEPIAPTAVDVHDSETTPPY